MRKTTEQFIKEAKMVHGDKYDYSKVEYINNRTKVCIICPKHGEFWITPHSQSNVLVLLNRYKLDINQFYDSLNQDKYDFISRLKNDSKIQENIAVTSSILNLIDDVEKGIIKKEIAHGLSCKLLSYCRGNTVNCLLSFWIKKFLL